MLIFFVQEKSSTLTKRGGRIWGKGDGYGFLCLPALHSSRSAHPGEPRSSRRLWEKRFQEYSAQTCSAPTMTITKACARTGGLTSSATLKESSTDAGVLTASNSPNGFSSRSDECLACGMPSKKEPWRGRTLVRKSVHLRARMSNCIQNYESSSAPDMARTPRALLTDWNHLFTFPEPEGVEPTNNSAERGIRPASGGEKSVSEINPRTESFSLQGCLRPPVPAFFNRKTPWNSWSIPSPLIDLRD